MSELINIADRARCAADKLDALACVNLKGEFLNGAAADGLAALIQQLANEVREMHDELYSIEAAKQLTGKEMKP
jgi:hypothetical protein